jgi:hypothetical protein
MDCQISVLKEKKKKHVTSNTIVNYGNSTSIISFKFVRKRNNLKEKNWSFG